VITTVIYGLLTGDSNSEAVVKLPYFRQPYWRSKKDDVPWDDYPMIKFTGRRRHADHAARDFLGKSVNRDGSIGYRPRFPAVLALKLLISIHFSMQWNCICFNYGGRFRRCITTQMLWSDAQFHRKRTPQPCHSTQLIGFSAMRGAPFFGIVALWLETLKGRI